MSNQPNLTQARSQAGQFTRRHFLRLTGTAAAGAVVQPRIARAFVPEVLIGGAVIIGAAWIGWKLGKLAKDKLWPAPELPAPTNPPPYFYPTNTPPANPRPGPGTNDAGQGGGGVADLGTDGLVCRWDIADAGLVSPVDGRPLTRYGCLVFQESADLKAWTDHPFECWYNGSWMVFRFGAQVEQLTLTRDSVIYLTAPANAQGFWRAKA